MKLKGQLQWTDYLNSQLLHMRPNWATRITVYLFFGLMSASALYLSVVIGQFNVLGYMWPFFVFAASFLLYRYVIFPNQVKNFFNQQKELNLPLEIEITDTDLISSNARGYTNRPWKDFVRWKENEEVLILYHSEFSYNIIPKRFFTDTQQIETVKNFLEKNKVSVVKKRSIKVYAVYTIYLIIVALIAYINYRNASSR